MYEEEAQMLIVAPATIFSVRGRGKHHVRLGFLVRGLTASVRS
jgi:hypothetical protein